MNKKLEKTMVSVVWLCSLTVFGFIVSGNDAFYHTDLSTEESFIVHATEISNILQTLISLVKAAAETEGRLLNVPNIPLPHDFKSSTLEELFDKFEITSQSFRTKFFKFIKKEFESIHTIKDLICTNLSTEDFENTVDCGIASNESPEHIVAVVELDSDSRISEDLDNYLVSDSNSYEDSLYTMDDTTKYETDLEFSQSTVETSSGDIEELDTATEYPNDETSESQTIPLEASLEITTEQNLEQFLEEVSNFGEAALEDDVDIDDSERFSDRSGLSAYERPLNFPITLVPGLRGVDFPDYEYIPQTSFTCEDKEYIPGFYADLDVDCQVFHVCLPDRVESFLCPSGTQFNQQILTCDYWFNFTCTKTADYYSVNADLPRVQNSEHFVDSTGTDESESCQTLSLLGYDMTIMPVQFSVTHFNAPETLESTVASTTEDLETIPVTEDLVQKMYKELYNVGSEDAPEQPASNVHQKKQRSNAKFFRTKLDRSGPISDTLDTTISSEMPVTSENVSPDMVTDSSTVSKAPYQTTASEESLSADVEKRFFVKEKGGKKIYVDKSVIPIILNRLFETADDVIGKKLLPFTKEVLVASYSKLHKVKKH